MDNQIASRQLDESNVVVALAFDEDYVVHGATTIESIVRNFSNVRRLSIEILDTGLSELSKERISYLFESRVDRLRIHRIPDGFLDEFPTRFHSRSTYARFALPAILCDCCKVVYLDSDTIVNDSLHYLYDWDIEDVALAAVPDVISHFRGEAVPYMERLGLTEDGVYFNAGVTVMNLGKWRDANYVASLRLWISENAELMLHSDQSALNALFWDRYVRLPMRWNVQVPLVAPVRYGWGCTREQADAVKAPAIVHYITERKPWRREFRVELSEYYWHYRTLLGWPEPLPQLSLRQGLQRIVEESVALKHRTRTWVRRKAGRIPAPN